ncbi:unnamed protein product [Linum trigynum]|uniref:Uncharacterized protein n=1 Tax=Linum trigynum TaxID=586398 RepID=A0AAV2CXZ0_9ROSI
MRKGTIRVIGNGQSTRAFKDPWIPGMNGEAISTGTNDNTLVADWIDGQIRSWNSHIFPPSTNPVFSQRIESILIGTEEAEDFWAWAPHPNGTSRLALPTTSSMSIKRNATSTEPPPSQMERDR